MAQDFFANRGFIVTGAASGIGLATARKLKARGARLVLWDMDEERLAAVGAELGAHTTVLNIDNWHWSDVRETANLARHQLKEIDGIVHAAGVLFTGDFDMMDVE